MDHSTVDWGELRTAIGPATFVPHAIDRLTHARTVLGAGVEDYAGLWESVWELRSVHPEQTTESLVATARGILMSLLSAHHIELYWCQEPYGDTTLIPDVEARELLTASGAFDEPTEDAISVRFSATPAGDDLYRTLWNGPSR